MKNKLLNFAKNHTIISFYLLCLVLPIALEIPYLFISLPNFISLLGPALSVIIIIKFANINLKFGDLIKKISIRKTEIKWYLAVILISIILVISTGYISSLLSGAEVKFSSFKDLSAFFIILTGIIVGATSEELGWRGLMLPLFQKKNNAVISSLLVGLCWGLWHYPMIFSVGIFGFVIFVAGAIGLSIIYTWFYVNTSGNLFTAILFHTTINVCMKIVPIKSNTGYAIHTAIIWIIAGLIVFVFGTTLLSKKHRSDCDDIASCLYDKNYV